MDELFLLTTLKDSVEVNEKQRKSQYRGISKNGKCWQVQMSIFNTKFYLCQLQNEKMAAKLYDFVMIQNKGLNSRLNFSYTNAELLAILTNESILKMKKEKAGVGQEK